jgi:NAD(P)H-dependent nitrite reductase small subunit
VRHHVGRLDSFPDGTGRLVEIAGREIALFRRGDRVFALENVCPHRGAALAFGDVREDVVYCPLHAWPFHLPTGACLDRDGVRVESYPVHVEGGEVHLEL